jgi:integrase
MRARKEVYGRGRTYQRNGIWWIAFSHRGKRYAESAGRDATQADAVRLLKRRLGEAVNGQVQGSKAEKVTVDDLLALVITDYELKGRRSARRMIQAQARLLEEFDAHAALDVNAGRLDDYIALRQRDGAALATIKYELSILRRAFTLAVRRQMLPYRPAFPTLKTANARSGFFEDEDYQKVRAALPEPIGNAIAFAFLTGWRVPSEVLKLTWNRVDFTAGVVRLDTGTTKNGRARVFPFDTLPALVDVLRRQRLYTDAHEALTGRKIELVFHREGRKIVDYRDAWAAACKAAGCVGRIPHDLRRTAARNLLRAGVADTWAMRLMGHETRSIFDRYAISNEVDLREAVTKLAESREKMGTR